MLCLLVKGHNVFLAATALGLSSPHISTKELLPELRGDLAFGHMGLQHVLSVVVGAANVAFKGPVIRHKFSFDQTTE